jgi:hypothetical protein
VPALGRGPSGTSDLDCSREVVPGVFVPQAQCEWLGPPPGDEYPDHVNVLGTPMVSDLGTQAGEFSVPVIIFISYNCNDGGDQSCRGIDPACFGVIRVIDGQTCAQLATISSPTVVGSSALALADLDDNGHLDIIGARTDGGLAAWTQDVTGAWGPMWQTPTSYADSSCDWGGPSVHDLDDDGKPEVLFYGAVYDGPTGAVLDEHIAPGTLDPISSGYIPVAADVDADGHPELVSGVGLFDWDTATRHWTARAGSLGGGGRIAVADLGTYGADPAADDRATLDGKAEVVVVTAGVVRIMTLGGRQIFAATLPGVQPGSGGPPTIADFDGDGRAEIGDAGKFAYAVFDPDCNPGGDATGCPSGRTDGILWSQPSQDASSNVTGSSVFDFEGDGRNEVVYGDECFTRVYDGTSGQVMYSRYRTSCTWYENPVIADVDGDFNAEIVSTSNKNCNVGCPALDPIFDGIACLDPSDCPGAPTCGREAPGDVLGRCRCSVDEDCGGDNFVCRDPIAGASAAGKVCRAGHPGPATASGVRVIADSLDRWVNTRRIWNQHAYSVTNVGPGGVIPRTSEWMRNWDNPLLNTFRANAPGEGITGDGRAVTPDLTVRGATMACTAGMDTLSVEICNRGTEPVGSGVAVAATAGGNLICLGHSEAVLRAGTCATVSCAATAAVAAGPITVSVDDDGTGHGANTECREGNNSLTVAATACP